MLTQVRPITRLIIRLINSLFGFFRAFGRVLAAPDADSKREAAITPIMPRRDQRSPINGNNP